MKIAIEAQRIFRPNKHGMDIVTLEMIRCLQQIDRDNEYFILVKPDTDRQVLSETENFHIVEIPAAPYPVWEQILLPLKLKKIKPDLLHCTSNTAPLFNRIPLVLTLHDILYMKKINLKEGSWYHRLGNLYRKRIVPKIIQRSEQIITASDFEKEEIKEYFSLPEEKIKTVYNAQNTEFSLISDIHLLMKYKKKLKLPDYFILYLGNTHPNKNLKNVIRALKILHQYEQTRIPLVIADVKSSYLDAILEELQAADMRESIQLVDYIPNRELVYLYNLATVFLYPSFYESSGIPILEAMASGTPVVTSRNAAMPEVAGDAAELVNPESPEDIASAVQKLICNEDIYESYKKKGIQRATFFHWEDTARQVLALYEELYQHNTFSPSTTTAL